MFNRSLLRRFSSSSLVMNASRSSEVIGDGALAKKVSQGPVLSSNLYLEPAQWKNLEPETIFQLYKERMVKLGPAYKHSEDELEALLTTSEHTGLPPSDIKKLYYRGIEGAMDIAGGKMQASYESLPYKFDELPKLAQTLVDQHREQRFYNRLAAHELPLLAQFHQEYTKVDVKEKPITYRYTTYIGEDHPNSKKVVLSLKTKNLKLNEKQLHKFQILARTRYDHTTDVFKMSSDKFEKASQNAKYLHDVLEKLIKESKDFSKDDFADIPLDTRHTNSKLLRRKKRGYEFPDGWKRPEDATKETFDFAGEMGKLLN